MSNPFKLCLCILLMCFSTILNSQVVNIPDANFKAWLINNVDINTNGDDEIQVSEAAAFTGTLNPISQDISSMVGLEAFSNITSLRCFNNNLTELDLSGNPLLEVLACYTNDITSLDVSMLPNLESFNAHTNQLTEIDITKNEKLDDFLIHNNFLSNIDLSNSDQLTKLVIYNNNISEIDLSMLPNLLELNISNNPITTLDVSNNLSLSTCRFAQAEVSTIDLSKNENLRYLDCSGNDISELDLTNNKLVRTLEISNNQIGELVIDSLLAMEDFYIGNNLFTSLDVSHMSVLEKLEVDSNLLVYLNISNGNNGELTLFNAQGNTELNCIKVDDVALAQSADWMIDVNTVYETDCTGVNSIDADMLSQNLPLFPNPVIDQLYFSTELDIETIQVYNQVGALERILPRKEINSIDFSQVKAGIYFVMIHLENGSWVSEKIVKL